MSDSNVNWEEVKKFMKSNLKDPHSLSHFEMKVLETAIEEDRSRYIQIYRDITKELFYEQAEM